MALVVLSPVTGTVVAMSDVPDPVFAEGMVGPGIAVDPVGIGDTSTAVAPIAGTVVSLHPHAFVVSDGRRGVLVHLGIDTVQLRGDGFTVHVAQGDAVRAGEPLITWSPAEVAAGGRSPLVPVLALEVTPDELEILTAPGTRVTAAGGDSPGTALLRIP
ncbi:PTS sugar transporter subunit IIA [Myceligenerans indicum]|uniref:PTS glucose transporter subunit IIA n=1 Tax=Myceligenerans indicum TaxID=2593663 RepID=A0ABS1LKG2_9MICO|nr:PTS glucose transporter subunit IIA [Myceligenerans indicum]MBL0886052.1 PTS glucose transporter subunit IIA [Myceligenerans indicum]